MNLEGKFEEIISREINKLDVEKKKEKLSLSPEEARAKLESSITELAKPLFSSAQQPWVAVGGVPFGSGRWPPMGAPSPSVRRDQLEAARAEASKMEQRLAACRNILMADMAQSISCQ